MTAFLISEVWKFWADWARVSGRYDRNFRFVPAASLLIQRRIVDFLRAEFGRPGTDRHDAIVLSLDVPIREEGEREPLGEALAGRVGLGVEERAISLVDLVATLNDQRG